MESAFSNSPDFNERNWEPEKKAPPRFSPRVIAALNKGKSNDHLFQPQRLREDRPTAAPTSKRVQKPKKQPKQKSPMIDFKIDKGERPVPEAGKAPEGIQGTKDYNQFKFLKTNRPVDTRHVNRLLNEIRSKNLLHLNPIIVNGNMEVIDGQHRLEAAKRLGVTIFYAQDDNVTQNDIASLNSNKKNWALMDYLRFYAEQGGYKDYENFLEFVSRHGAMPVATLLSLCSKDGKVSRNYKDGVIDISEMRKAELVLDYLSDYDQHTPFSRTSRFIDALAFIVRTGLYDHGHMMNKLQQAGNSLQTETQVKGWILSLQRAYNFKMRDENIVLFLKRF
jgi:hypothetical protein